MRCAACGAVNTAGSRFCSSCGSPVGSRGDERRIVSVLFADLVGFTRLSETRDPEEIKNLVDRCFERLVGDITAFGGRVDKIIGDAIVALFGAPVAHEDDAERAVRAALAMQRSVLAYADEVAAPIAMRIGVNTGEVLVGSLRAGGEYTAMGDVVNTAQRLETACEPGNVLVGAATQAATASAIAYRPIDPLQAKGREAPVVAFVALEPLVPPGRRRRGRVAPLVGRSVEAARLREVLVLAAERSRAELVLVTGEAGVGKSRLVEEAGCWAGEEVGAQLFEGRCVPYGEANIWFPVADALRHGIGVPVDGDPAGTEPAVVEAVAATMGDDTDGPVASRVVRGLLELLGHPTPLRDLEPTNARAEMAWALQTFLDHACRRRPLVLVLSDLHWADDAVLELLDATTERLAACPLTVLATARPELLDRWVPPVGRHNTSVLHLDPLDAQSATELLVALADQELSPELADLLVERSGGNPFFLEELVALTAARGGAGLDLANDAGALAEATRLPDTLRSLVAARLDALDGIERTLLDWAAVWGRSGSIVALSAMAAASGLGPVEQPLDVLLERELLVREDERWRFRSDLVREVAYATLTKADRAKRHAGIAFHLIASVPAPEAASDRQVDVIAHHLQAASALAAEFGRAESLPADLHDTAVVWLEEAASRARRDQAFPVASRLLAQALELLDDAPSPERARLLIAAARTSAAQREHEVARGRLAEAESIVASLRPSAGADLEVGLVLAAGDAAHQRGDDELAVELLDEAARRAEASGDLRLRAESLRLRGLCLLALSRFDDAEASIGEARRLFASLGDAGGEAWGLQNLAWIAFLRGRAEEALDRLEAARVGFEQLGDAVGLVWVHGLQAWVSFHLGRYEEAEDLAERVIIDARQRADRWGEGMMLLLMAGIRLWSGRPDAARTVSRDALGRFRAIGDRLAQAQAVGLLGRSTVMAGEVDEGVAILVDALEAIPESGTIEDGLGVLASTLLGAAVQLGDVGLAERALRRWDGADAEPGGIGIEDLAVGRALLRLQRGEVAMAHRELRAMMAELPKEPNANSRAGVALVAATAGEVDEARTYIDSVLGDGRATYADRQLALLAALVLDLVAGTDPADALAALRANLAGVGDVVAAALVDVAAQVAGPAPSAPGSRDGAGSPLPLSGWVAVLERACRPAPV